jgi:hypothetical protein
MDRVGDLSGAAGTPCGAPVSVSDHDFGASVSSMDAMCLCLGKCCTGPFYASRCGQSALLIHKIIELKSMIDEKYAHGFVIIVIKKTKTKPVFVFVFVVSRT